MVLEAIRYQRGSLKILNQLKLPYAEEYDHIRSCKDAWQAIKDMRTRGAPAIAIVAALSVAVELEELANNNELPRNARDAAELLDERLKFLVTSRPTAVNLSDAVAKLTVVINDAIVSQDASGNTVKKAYIEAAEKMLAQDVQDNQAIGQHGAEWILGHCKVSEGSPVSIVTHCNTGSLATAGYGTALGVIRSVHALARLKRAFCTETRPYNQGSRLTAFELVHDKIPATLVTDSMVGALLKTRKETDSIAAIVTGADRVAANGDTANKIGTYTLAVLAKRNCVKFLIAAPRTTIDLKTASGEDIVIEQRPGREVTTARGPETNGPSPDLSRTTSVSIAAPGIDVWNPAFDVTPAELIDGIITEVGVVEKDSLGAFNLQQLFAKS